MVHRVRWPIHQREAIDRQLATTMQEPLHHREGPYTLVSRLDRDGDSSGPGSRPQSQDRRYRENAKKGPLVEPHLGPVQPIVAVHLPTAPQLPANPIAATASHNPIPQPTVPAVTASPPRAIQARRREQRLRAAAPQAPPAPRGLSLPGCEASLGPAPNGPPFPTPLRPTPSGRSVANKAFSSSSCHPDSEGRGGRQAGRGAADQRRPGRSDFPPFGARP